MILNLEPSAEKSRKIIILCQKRKIRQKSLKKWVEYCFLAQK